jgi:ABC-2 type transport system permease protein
MAYLLSTPNTRTTIALTQAVAIVITLTALFAGLTLAGIVISELMFPDAIDLGAFVMINLGVLAYFFAVSGLAYIFSCLFNDSKHSLQLCTDIPVAFLLLHMLGQLGGDLEIFRSFTLMTLFDANAILSPSYNPLPLILLILIGIASYATAILIFRRRNLPL